MSNDRLFHFFVSINTYRKLVMLVSFSMSAFEIVLANAWIPDIPVHVKSAQIWVKKNSLKQLSMITSISRSSELSIIVFRCCSISSLVPKTSVYHKFIFFVKNIFAVFPSKTLLYVSEKPSDQRPTPGCPSEIEKWLKLINPLKSRHL